MTGEQDKRSLHETLLSALQEMLVLESDTREAIENARKPYNADSLMAAFDAGGDVRLMTNTLSNLLKAESASVTLRIAITKALDCLKAAGPQGGSGS